MRAKDLKPEAPAADARAVIEMDRRDQDLGVTAARRLGVLIVDDHEMVGAALHHAMSCEPALDVVGVAPDGHEATRLAAVHGPDVIVTDFQLKQEQSTLWFDRFREAAGGCAVLVVTGWAAERSMLAALDAGADGFLSKEQPMSALVDGVLRVADGETVVAPQLMSALAKRSVARGPDRTRLSRRELQILERLAGGFDTTDVATELGISPHTVRNHVAKVMLRLGAHSRLEAVTTAVRQGIIAPPLPD